MFSLLIDTATDRGLVSLLKGKIPLGEALLPFGIHNSHTLFQEMDSLFKSLAIPKKDINLIICGTGPGSYTGIRVGAAAAKALSFALELPLVGISTLEGFVPDADGVFAALIDAKISGVYLLKGVKERGRIRYLGKPSAAPIETLGEELNDVEVLVAPHLAHLQPKIAAFYPDRWKWEEKGLSSRQMAHNALDRYAKGGFSLDGSLDLLYLRKTQAELEKGF